MIGLGSVFAGALSWGEQAPESSGKQNRGPESRKKAGDAGKKDAAPNHMEESAPPKALVAKRDIRPGRPRLKPAHPIAKHVEAKKRPEEHAPAVAGAGSGVALPKKPKVAPPVAKRESEIPKTEARPGPTASAAGSSALNGTSMSVLRHDGAKLASLGGITTLTPKGAAAVNGTLIKPKH